MPSSKEVIVCDPHPNVATVVSGRRASWLGRQTVREPGLVVGDFSDIMVGGFWVDEHTAVVLSRVALEIEVDSLIATCIAAWEPKAKARQELNARDLGRRTGELVSQLRSRGLQSLDDNDLFDAHINVVRITANRVLHPSGGPPITNPIVVQAVLHAFMVFAELTSVAKSKVQNS